MASLLSTVQRLLESDQDFEDISGLCGVDYADCTFLQRPDRVRQMYDETVDVTDSLKTVGRTLSVWTDLPPLFNVSPSSQRFVDW